MYQMTALLQGMRLFLLGEVYELTGELPPQNYFQRWIVSSGGHFCGVCSRIPNVARIVGLNVSITGCYEFASNQL